LRRVLHLPNAEKWKNLTSSALEIEILNVMQKHQRPVTHAVLRFFFQDLATFAPYYHAALVSLMRRGEISRSGTRKAYQYMLTPKGRSKARAAA